MDLVDITAGGKLSSSMNTFPVDRAGRSIDSLKMAEEVLARDGVIIIYPEGTTTKDPDMWPQVGRLGMIRLALTTGAPVIPVGQWGVRSEEHTSELQSRGHLVCRLLLEKKKRRVREQWCGDPRNTAE